MLLLKAVANHAASTNMSEVANLSQERTASGNICARRSCTNRSQNRRFLRAYTPSPRLPPGDSTDKHRVRPLSMRGPPPRNYDQNGCLSC
ncbi:hypothetical protein M404DRAFT_675870 [Pisolithus tinctorius Marx 270]|uniref:Uncharacterized protein n=1 Tax=Pisolithus tinctorius Marx 270 TaxID=870435 RepID=A0A0C3PUD8_PISTI|nr:hypothetical protein M404DRAFT_675870 [Pisolithus tinctorius Marx 270]